MNIPCVHCREEGDAVLVNIIMDGGDTYKCLCPGCVAEFQAIAYEQAEQKRALEKRYGEQIPATIQDFWTG